MSKVKEFTYTKANGDVSERVVFTLNPVSDMLFGLDLTEFSEDEREEYIDQLVALDNLIKGAIIDMGLNSQYRNFKESGIEYTDVRIYGTSI